MDILKQKFIRIKDTNIAGGHYCIMQRDDFQLVGLVRMFQKGDIQEQKRRLFLDQTNINVTGKATGYRVYCFPYSSIHPIKGMDAETIRNLMADMADYYVSSLPDSMREAIKDY